MNNFTRARFDVVGIRHFIRKFINEEISLDRAKSIRSQLELEHVDCRFEPSEMVYLPQGQNMLPMGWFPRELAYGWLNKVFNDLYPTDNGTVHDGIEMIRSTLETEDNPPKPDTNDNHLFSYQDIFRGPENNTTSSRYIYRSTRTYIIIFRCR